MTMYVLPITQHRNRELVPTGGGRLYVPGGKRDEVKGRSLDLQLRKVHCRTFSLCIDTQEWCPTGAIYPGKTRVLG